ncbi:MAG: hypothetical protein NZL98_00690, partial [Anaerolineales bacterium]|nr:hypothetical protein [Anaerolineales bacterium]
SHARAQMKYWKMERLHYALLADYRQAFNHFLFEEAQSLWLANSERDLVLLQAERWQPLLDPAYALEEFGHLEPWSSLQARGESPFVAFRRIALQDDVTTWIMVHILRKEFKRAVEFAETLEAKIPHWCDAHPDDPNFLKPSWLHTLARHERALWRNTAKVYIGEKTQPILEEMKKAVAELEKLLRHSQEEVVFPDRGDGETGFLGHPAEKKVLRLIALYYNYIGYGYANLGATRSAKDAYSRALRAMRDVDFPHMEATTRNNFSRVLSDRSHVRGRRLCLDGLKLRKEQGLEIPLAYSYNTLALIDNDHGRSDLAWMEAAIAVAYFRRANDPRGLGLALLQLGEALRRLANRRDEIFQLRGDSPEIVFKAADRALSEAVRIFTTGPLAGEKVRRVEAWIELGSLERDRMRTVEEDSPSRERYYRDAVSHLTQAAQLAHELGNKRLELDARVNLAWTHYRYPDFVLAERALQQAEDLLPDDCRIQEGFLPGPERNDIYVYEQLSRMEGLRGRIALESFLQIVEEKKKNIPDREERRRQIHEDEKAQEYLKMAAEHFVKALTYAQLQSPRSHALRLTYDSIYDYLKEFNITELNDFYRQVRLAIDRYGLIQKYEPNSLCLIDLGRLDEFLEQMFGLSSEEGAFHER